MKTGTRGIVMSVVLVLGVACAPGGCSPRPATLKDSRSASRRRRTGRRRCRSWKRRPQKAGELVLDVYDLQQALTTVDYGTRRATLRTPEGARVIDISLRQYAVRSWVNELDRRDTEAYISLTPARAWQPEEGVGPCKHPVDMR